MEITLYLAAILALVLGTFLGYLIGKVQLNKKTLVIQTQFENEKSFHELAKQRIQEIQILLEKSNSDFHGEQKSRIKFETQLTETQKQLNTQMDDYEKIKGQLSTINQNIVNSESEKTKAETQLKEARSSTVELNQKLEKYKSEISSLQDQLVEIKTSNADLSAKYKESLKAIEEQKKFVTDTNTVLKESFNSLSSDALKSNNQTFIDLAKATLDKHINDTKSDLKNRQQAIDSMVKPLNESLTKFETKISEIEKARQGAYSEIKIFLDGMKGTTEKLQQETNQLVTALKTSHVRGKYGEIGLRRIVEFAGMSEFCDFDEQPSIITEDGRLRPDMIIKLPGQRRVIVDAKVPLSSYMQAFETVDDTVKKNFLLKHASSVREHLKKLSAKAYWSQFEDSPDYVIMYLQIESSFGAALEVDRTLIEDGLKNNVIFATPTTLITMLRTIAFSWQQVSIEKNIYEIRDAGVELYNRVTTLIQHIAAVGNNLDSATQNYNKVVGSLESRFIPQVRKLKEIGGTLMDKNIPELNAIEKSVRNFSEISSNTELVPREC